MLMGACRLICLPAAIQMLCQRAVTRLRGCMRMERARPCSRPLKIDDRLVWLPRLHVVRRQRLRFPRDATPASQSRGDLMMEVGALRHPQGMLHDLLRNVVHEAIG